MIGATAVATRWRVTSYARSLRQRFDDRLEERTRVARDLHDTLMQTVLASKLLAESGITVERASDGRDLFKRLSLWLETAAEEGRAAVNSLRSSAIDTDRLADAFELAAHSDTNDGGADIQVVIVGERLELHSIVRDEIYRIGVEAIRNARLHSDASHINIALDYGYSLILRVSDDGNGIDADVLNAGKVGHFGLAGMRERAEQIGAKFTIDSAPTGTEITVIVPGKVAFVNEPRLSASIFRLAISKLRKRS